MSVMRWMLMSVLMAAGPVRAELVEENVPVLIRVYTQFVQIPHERMTEVMGSEAAKTQRGLYSAVRALVKEKKASILESCIGVTRPGGKMTVESLMEYIYPSEYNPPGFGIVVMPLVRRVGPPLRPETPSAFETRSVGVTLEIEPNLGANEKIIDLRFAPELVHLLRIDTFREHRDRWGRADLRRPVFEAIRTSTGVTLAAGEFTFVGSLTPALKTGGADPENRLMLFVRADLVRVGAK